MSSALQSALLSLQQSSYLSLAVLIAAGYDYILVFPKEIEYIWCNQWTWVSALFLLVRYFGLCALGSATLGQTLMVIECWSYLLFLGAADFVMILRVWSMYNRSRIILGMLLTVFSIEMIFVGVDVVFDSILKTEQYFAVEVLENSFCSSKFSPPILGQLSNIFQLIFSGVLCSFAIFQFVRQKLQMYHATKQWQLNQYMNLLVQQGIIYFFVIFLLNLAVLLAATGVIAGTGWEFMLVAIVGQLPVFILAPRFIISIRVTYDRDVQGRRGDGIDVGFGLSAISNRDNAAGSPMLFATGVQSEGTGNVEANDRQNEGIERLELV